MDDFDTSRFDEPAWIKKARTIPLYSTWESRQQMAKQPMPDGAALTKPEPQE